MIQNLYSFPRLALGSEIELRIVGRVSSFGGVSCRKSVHGLGYRAMVGGSMIAKPGV